MMDVDKLRETLEREAKGSGNMEHPYNQGRKTLAEDLLSSFFDDKTDTQKAIQQWVNGEWKDSL